MDNTLYLASTGSTNEDAYKLALEGKRHGFAVVAGVQTAGKGRLGRRWETPHHTGLCCSIVLRPKLPFIEFPRVTLTAGLALCRVIENITGLATFGLKWPNDLYCEGKKCGGILVESSSPASPDDASFVIVGIGVNVNSRPSDFPPELQETVTSLRSQTSNSYSIEELFVLIRASLLSHLALHEEQGFGVILEEWRKRDVLYGKEMQWLTVDKKVVTGIGLGPDDTGQLLVKDREGKHHAILSGDVSLKE